MLQHHISADVVRGMMERSSERASITAEIIAEVLAWAEKYQGRKLTARNKPDGWHIRKEYGMTHLESDAYGRARYRDDAQDAPGANLSALIAYQETFVDVPTPAELADALGVSAHNAREQRRDEAIRSAKPETIAAALNTLTDALVAVDKALPWDMPDRYDILSAAGYEHGFEPARR